MKNISFNNMQTTLENWHIKNNKFFNIYKDPRVESLDPYDPNLTPEEIAIIKEECTNNIYYFLAEVVKLPKYGTADTIPFELNISNLATIWCAQNNLDSYVVNSRGCNSIMTPICIMIWEIICANHTKEVVINNKYINGYLIRQKMKLIIELLPEYLRVDVVTDNEDGDIIRSGIKRCSMCNFPISQKNIDDIKTYNTNTISFYPDFEYMPVNVELIKPYTISRPYQMIQSLPGIGVSRQCEKAMSMIEGSYKFSHLLFELDIEIIRHYLLDIPSAVIYIEYPWNLLGKDEVWLEKMKLQLDYNIERINREIFLKR
jgi:hypothetical protein